MRTEFRARWRHDRNPSATTFATDEANDDLHTIDGDGSRFSFVVQIDGIIGWLATDWPVRHLAALETSWRLATGKPKPFAVCRLRHSLDILCPGFDPASAVINRAAEMTSDSTRSTTVSSFSKGDSHENPAMRKHLTFHGAGVGRGHATGFN
jgi:hypothetical protein